MRISGSVSHNFSSCPAHLNFEYLLVNILKLNARNTALKVARELDDLTCLALLVLQYVRKNDEENIQNLKMHKLFSKKKKNKLTREEKQKITTMNNQNLFYEIKKLFIYLHFLQFLRSLADRYQNNSFYRPDYFCGLCLSFRLPTLHYVYEYYIVCNF